MSANASKKTRSDSSLAQRNALKQNFVKVPSLAVKVDITTYIHLAQKLFEDANHSYQHGNLVGAYIDYQKFLVLILDRVPKHPAYAALASADSVLHGCVAIKGKAWIEEVRIPTLQRLEAVVKAMDDAEDRRKEEQLDMFLMDELEECDSPIPAAASSSTHANNINNSNYNDNSNSNYNNSNSNSGISGATFVENRPAEVIESVITLESLKLLEDVVTTQTTTTTTVAIPEVLPEVLPEATSEEYVQLPPQQQPQAAQDVLEASAPPISQYEGEVVSASPTATLIPEGVVNVPPPVPVRDTRKLDILRAFPDEAPSPPLLNSTPLPRPQVATPNVVTGVVISRPSPAALRFLSPEDVLILKHILHQGSRFPLPPPATLPANLFFNESNLSIPLLKDDFHVSYTGFLGFLPPELQMAKSAIETNRCFFVHLGIATGVHPFLMQSAFREISHRLMQQQDCWYADLLQSVLGYACFVDANALCFIWPEEFLPYRFLFISGINDSPIFSTFVSHEINEQGPQAVKKLREVIIHCNGNHFTLLRRLRTNTSESTIDLIMEAARKNKFLVQENVAQPCLGQRSIREIVKLAMST